MLACKHERDPFGSPMCIHLRTYSEPWIDYVKWYTGSGMDTELLCVPCAGRREQQLSVEVESICQECFEFATTEICDLVKSGGKPEIRDRSEPFNSTLKEITLPKELGTVIDIAPVNASRQSIWMLMAEGGQIFRFHCETGGFAEVARASVAPEPDHEAWGDRVLKRRLHVSNRGEFAAVVNDYGRYGQIIDLRSREVTLVLDGGDYFGGTVPFSFAFADMNTKVVAIHRTAWNRLDFSDPASGKLLSERGPTSYRSGEEQPAHYLDYFHGALYVNPGSTGILDDGWVWHPLGIPVAWSLERWLSHNVWESEDGPTKIDLCVRGYYWDKGMTWMDEHTVAIAGIGDDDVEMIDGARIFDVTGRGGGASRWGSTSNLAREIIAFAGPAGLFFSDGISLYSSDGSGLSRWNPSDGVRTGHLQDFEPTHLHRGAGELVQVHEGTLRKWTWS